MYSLLPALPAQQRPKIKRAAAQDELLLHNFITFGILLPVGENDSENQSTYHLPSYLIGNSII